MRDGSTARTRREALKAELSRVLDRARVGADVVLDELGEACGVGLSIAHRWTDTRRPESPSLADVVQMPRPIALELLRWTANKLGVDVVDRVDVRNVGDDVSLMARVAREVGEMLTAYGDELGPHADPARLEREALDVLEVAHQVIARCKAAKARSNVTPIGSGR